MFGTDSINFRTKSTASLLASFKLQLIPNLKPRSPSPTYTQPTPPPTAPPSAQHRFAVSFLQEKSETETEKTVIRSRTSRRRENFNYFPAAINFFSTRRNTIWFGNPFPPEKVDVSAVLRKQHLGIGKMPRSFATWHFVQTNFLFLMIRFLISFEKARSVARMKGRVEMWVQEVSEPHR